MPLDTEGKLLSVFGACVLALGSFAVVETVCHPGPPSDSSTPVNVQQDNDRSGLHYGVHVGPHIDMSDGQLKIGPSIGLGYDF